MLSYCVKCKINTRNTNTVVSKTSNGKTMILSKSTMVLKNQNLLKNKKQKDY